MPDTPASPHVVACGDCGAPMVLRPSRFRPFWSCTRFPECRGTHGAHPDGRPLGVPANAATRAARIQAHAAFDSLWRSGGMSRSAAYRWLAKAMGRSEVHMSGLSQPECDEVIRLVNERPHTEDTP